MCWMRRFDRVEVVWMKVVMRLEVDGCRLDWVPKVEEQERVRS